MNTLVLALLLCAQEKPFAGASEEGIAAALARAKSENRRVLIVWGKNDAEESTKLHAQLTKDAALKKKLLYEYDVVYSSHLDLAKKYEADVTALPAITILAADGAVLSNERPAAELLAQLEKHQAKPWVAKELYDAALKSAKESKKRLFLHFGAPW